MLRKSKARNTASASANTAVISRDKQEARNVQLEYIESEELFRHTVATTVVGIFVTCKLY